MSDELGNAPAVEGGNAPTAPDQGNPEAAPTVPGDGHAAPELTREMIQGSKEFKELQAGFTKKSQRNSELEQQIQQYQRIVQDPLGHGISDAQLNQYLNMKGYELRKLNTQHENDIYGDQSQATQDSQILQHMGPLQDRIDTMQRQMQNMVQQNVITELNDNFPDWHKYEDDIKDNLQRYPHLGQTKDGIKQLYDLCVPPEVKEAAILEKMQGEQAQKQALASASQPAATPPKAEPTDSSTAGNFAKSWEKAKEIVGVKDPDFFYNIK